MEGIILHRQVEVNGIQMHVAEKGEGPVVLLIHGFPELWYSWRHQIISLASHGYRAVAPDLRGYGDTDAPQAIQSYTIYHLVGDLISLIDSLGVDKVFVVGHDWGAIIAWNLCLFRPDRVKALVILSVPFLRRNPSCKPVDAMRKRFGDDYYICRFQEPGEMEAEFAEVPTTFIIRNILTTRKPGPVMSPRAKHSSHSAGPPPPLPSWLSQEDIDYYASKFNQKGFTGPLNYYRNFDTNWELTAPYTGVQIRVPTKFITGNEDMVYTTPGHKEYIHGNAFKEDVPFLQDVIVMEGAGHFINQEKPDEITKHIYEFIKNF